MSEDQIEKDLRVLSIQSHVVSGYVGNKSAAFPLQVLGFEVDAINSVQFSNHTGYGSWKGTVLNSTDLADLMDGLRGNDLLHYSHILTGYVGSESFLNQVVEVIKEMKMRNPKAVYVCDPVMGDNGQLYVPAELLPIYRDSIIPLADILTPNQFEAELLTGMKIENERDAVKAMHELHKKGARNIVISSSVLGGDSVLTAFGSSFQDDSAMQCWKLEIPRLPYIFTGTGDLFASLLLAWMEKTSGNLATALEKTVDSLQSVLRRTASYAEQRHTDHQSKIGCKLLELRLVQSKSDLENPGNTYKANPLPNQVN
nr:EOG090X09AY [Eulimnadia texana]